MTQPELTERERQVMECLKQGMKDPQIAETLRIGEETVGFHFRNIFQKIHVRSRHHALLYYLKVKV